MKLLNLSIIGIIIACISIILVVLYVHNTSISQLNSTDYEMQRIYSFCQNPEITNNGNDVFVTCHHSINYTRSESDLPLPIYKRVVCQSTYGCSGHYNYMLQIPSDLLSEVQKQQAINEAFNDTLKRKYPNTQLSSFQIQSHDDQWFAEINFLIPHCDWYLNSRVNLNIMQVVSSTLSQQNIVC